MPTDRREPASFTPEIGKPDAWGYLPVVSPDNRILVQIFVDLDTGLIEHVSVALRDEPWHSWGPPIKCAKDAS